MRLSQAIALSLAGVLLCLFSFIPPSSAQEAVSITTYYPAPEGTYRFLRLYPGSAAPACNNSNRGNLYYSSTNHRLYVCESVLGSSQWVGFLWAVVPASPNDAFFFSTRPNLGNGNVGIGANPTSGASPVNMVGSGNVDANDVRLMGANLWLSRISDVPGSHCGMHLYDGAGSALSNDQFPCPPCATSPKTCCPAGYTQVGNDFESSGTREMYFCVKN